MISRIGLSDGNGGGMIFKPLDDITPLELAEIMALFFNLQGGSDLYDELSKEAKRHFRHEPAPEPQKQKGEK